MLRAAPAMQQLLDAAATSIGKDSGVADYALRAGEMRPIEVFNDQPTSISVLVLSKFTIIGGGTAREQPVVLGLTTALIHLPSESECRAPCRPWSNMFRIHAGRAQRSEIVLVGLVGDQARGDH